MNIKCGVDLGGGLLCRTDGLNLRKQGFKITFPCSRHISPEEMAQYSMLNEAWLNGAAIRPNDSRVAYNAGFEEGRRQGRVQGAEEEMARMAPLLAKLDAQLAEMENRVAKALGGPSEPVSGVILDGPETAGRDLLKLSKRVDRM